MLMTTGSLGRAGSLSVLAGSIAINIATYGALGSIVELLVKGSPTTRRVGFTALLVIFVVTMPIAMILTLPYFRMWDRTGTLGFLWVPAEAMTRALTSSCPHPGDGSFTCPNSQGGHDRLFFASFYLVYLPVGLALVMGARACIRRRRHQY
jgi:hypothetical protein